MTFAFAPARRGAAAVALAAAFAATPFAAHAEPMQPTRAQLQSLCATCAIVTDVRVENRNGEAKGVGAVGGAVAGGMLGDSTLGKVAGAAVGGVVGHQVERYVRRHRVWVIESARPDGTKQRHEFNDDPKLSRGSVVIADGTSIRKR